MGPIALFVVLVIMPVAALVMFVVAMLLSGVATALLSVPVVSWVSFGGGLGLGAAVLAVRRRRTRVTSVT